MHAVLLTPEQRDAYRERQRQLLLPRLRLGLAAGAVLFAAFIPWDLLVAPGLLMRTLPVRLAVALSLLGLSAASRLPLAARHPTVLLCLATTLSATVLVLLASFMPVGHTFAVGGLMLMVLLAGTLVPNARMALPAYSLPLLAANVTAVALDAESLLLVAVNVFFGLGCAMGVVLAWYAGRQDLRAFALEEALREQARTDALTGLLNRRAFLDTSCAELQRAARHHYPVSLMMVDIDRFKRVNDTHGHPVGDAVIRALARVCSQTVRSSDLCARMGGEEFALLLPHTEELGALELAERLREAVAAVAVAGRQAVAVHFTVSIGVARWERGEPLEVLLQRADDALYVSKNDGRDRVTAAQAAAVA